VDIFYKKYYPGMYHLTNIRARLLKIGQNTGYTFDVSIFSVQNKLTDGTKRTKVKY
jgi:hypothetical protein